MYLNRTSPKAGRKVSCWLGRYAFDKSNWDWNWLVNVHRFTNWIKYQVDHKFSRLLQIKI